MGMYNEVCKSCPKCGRQMNIQISQVVLGFGNFDLDSKDSFSELDERELKQVYSFIKDETFQCYKEGCEGSWSLKNGDSLREKLLNKLIGESY